MGVEQDPVEEGEPGHVAQPPGVGRGADADVLKDLAPAGLLRVVPLGHPVVRHAVGDGREHVPVLPLDVHRVREHIDQERVVGPVPEFVRREHEVGFALEQFGIRRPADRRPPPVEGFCFVCGHAPPLRTTLPVRVRRPDRTRMGPPARPASNAFAPPGDRARPTPAAGSTILTPDGGWPPGSRLGRPPTAGRYSLALSRIASWILRKSTASVSLNQPRTKTSRRIAPLASRTLARSAGVETLRNWSLTV